MSDITLKWSGPFSLQAESPLSVFRAEAGRMRGVYIWGVPSPQGLLIHYVGETDASFAGRQREHLGCYRSGSYTIYEADAFSQGSRQRLYDGFIYSQRKRLQQLPDFRARQAELMRELDGMLSVIQVFVAPLVATQRIRRRIESALVRMLYAGEPQESSFQEERMQTWKRAPNETEIQVESCADVVLRGVPSCFAA